MENRKAIFTCKKSVHITVGVSSAVTSHDFQMHVVAWFCGSISVLLTDQ